MRGPKVDPGLNVSGNDYLDFFKVTSKFTTATASKQCKDKVLKWVDTSYRCLHDTVSYSQFILKVWSSICLFKIRKCTGHIGPDHRIIDFHNRLSWRKDKEQMHTWYYMSSLKEKHYYSVSKCSLKHRYVFLRDFFKIFVVELIFTFSTNTFLRREYIKKFKGFIWD